jgi:hypothetical protein
MIEIGIQQVRVELIGDTVNEPGDAIGLVSAHHQSADNDNLCMIPHENSPFFRRSKKVIPLRDKVI